MSRAAGKAGEGLALEEGIKFTERAGSTGCIHGIERADDLVNEARKDVEGTHNVCEGPRRPQSRHLNVHPDGVSTEGQPASLGEESDRSLARAASAFSR